MKKLFIVLFAVLPTFPVATSAQNFEILGGGSVAVSSSQEAPDGTFLVERRYISPEGEVTKSMSAVSGPLLGRTFDFDGGSITAPDICTSGGSNSCSDSGFCNTSWGPPASCGVRNGKCACWLN